MSLDAVLERLALLRPVFHSEADFQQALAWEVHSIDPSLRVRLAFGSKRDRLRGCAWICS